MLSDREDDGRPALGRFHSSCPERAPSQLTVGRDLADGHGPGATTDTWRARAPNAQCHIVDRHKGSHQSCCGLRAFNAGKIRMCTGLARLPGGAEATVQFKTGEEGVERLDDMGASGRCQSRPAIPVNLRSED